MPARPRYSHPILYGTLVVGTLDLLDAFIFFGVRNGVAPGRILQSIAAGVFGRASSRMASTAWALDSCCTTSLHS